eukprot:gene13495-15954_t
MEACNSDHLMNDEEQKDLQSQGYATAVVNLNKRTKDAIKRGDTEGAEALQEKANEAEKILKELVGSTEAARYIGLADC